MLVQKKEPFRAFKSKLRSMIIDVPRAVLYATGERLMIGLDLASGTTCSELKMANSQPSELEIDPSSKRLFVATREGLLLMFDISQQGTPVLINMVKCVLQPGSVGTSYIKEMFFDHERRQLICRMSSGIIYFFAMVKNQAQILELHEHYKATKNDKGLENVNKFCWISRLNCYCEGTKLGFLKIRVGDHGGECHLQFPMIFFDKIRLLHHDKTKNILFAASSDGQCFAWKLPPEWQAPWIEKKLINLRREANEWRFQKM